MVLNMTELSIAQWSNAQLDAARKLCTDGTLHDCALPIIVPTDSSVRVRVLAWDTADTVHETGSCNSSGRTCFCKRIP